MSPEEIEINTEVIFTDAGRLKVPIAQIGAHLRRVSEADYLKYNPYANASSAIERRRNDAAARLQAIIGERAVTISAQLVTPELPQQELSE